nr:YaaC family protein [uncultured Flavobacterium sp.]
MNDIWHFLREFESKDLVKRHIKKKFGYELNSSKAFEITSAFRQGRSYFESAKKSNISVKPLLQYYGIVALSRGLILILNSKSRENNITPSHGLKIKNWSDISASGKLEDIILKTSSGTFRELISSTKNISYFRAGSSAINWHSEYYIPTEEFEFNLKELSYSSPDLKKSVESWLGNDIPTKQLKALKHIENKTLIEIEGLENVDEIFPEILFKNQTITKTSNSTKITFECPAPPHLTQKWVSSFGVIGDPYVIPPFENLIFLNDISKMFAVSFIFGTISRYYPTTWNNITNGIKDDRVLPFAINLMDFLEEKYPQIIMDFISSPYKFEEK